MKLRNCMSHMVATMGPKGDVVVANHHPPLHATVS